MIYFVRSPNGGPIKIGHSQKPEVRRKSLEDYYGLELEMLATMEGGREEEKAIHSRFSHLRLWRTEQFRPAKDLMEFIGIALTDDIDPDSVDEMRPKGRSPRRIIEPSPKDFFIYMSIDNDDRYALRILAAKAGMSMAAYVRWLIRDHVEKESK
jgi:hypothetical protein